MAVEPFGRYLFWVDSESRDDLRFLVDLEPAEIFDFTLNAYIEVPAFCTCESYELRKDRPCKHIRAATDWCIFMMELPEKEEALQRKQMRLLISQAFGNP